MPDGPTLIHCLQYSNLHNNPELIDVLIFEFSPWSSIIFPRSGNSILIKEGARTKVMYTLLW